MHGTTGNSVSWFDISLITLGESVKAGEPIVAEWQQDAVHRAGQRIATVLRKVT